MPTLSTPTLTLGNTVSNKRDVTVAGNITFDAGDVGKTYRLEIKLYGDDDSNDALPSGDGVADDVIYTYNWSGLFLPKAYKSITVAAAGNFNYSELRKVDVSKLDEDPGNVTHEVGGVLVQMPRKDEVYASVTVTGVPVNKKSAVVTAGIGV